MLSVFSSIGVGVYTYEEELELLFCLFYTLKWAGYFFPKFHPCLNCLSLSSHFSLTGNT